MLPLIALDMDGTLNRFYDVPDSVVLALITVPIFVLVALDIRADNKDKRRAKLAKRVRYCERRRRAKALCVHARGEGK